MSAKSTNSPHRLLNLSADEIKRCRGALHRYLARRLNNPHDVQDLSQESWARLCKQVENEKCEAIKDPVAYIRKVANSVLCTWLDRKQRDPLYASDPIDDEIDVPLGAPLIPIEGLVKITQFLDEALPRLPKMQAAALLLAVRGHSRKEIAEKLGVAEDTAKEYLAKARGYLRSEYSKDK